MEHKSERRNTGAAKQMEITTAGFIRTRIKNFLGYSSAEILKEAILIHKGSSSRRAWKG